MIFVKRPSVVGGGVTITSIPEGRAAGPSTSTDALQDLQRTMTTLQSQVGKQAYLARCDTPNDERLPRLTVYYIQPTGPPSDKASSEGEHPGNHHAFGLRALPDSPDYAKDDTLPSCFGPRPPSRVRGG